MGSKRAIVVIPDTGWRELVEVGWNVLSEPEEIYDKWLKIIDDEYRRVYPKGVYGDSRAGEKMAKVIVNF